MARRARLRAAGLPLHIVQRGNNRGRCFFAPENYSLYLHHLENLARRFECKVHAYVLMTNHVHLLLTPLEANGASLLMKHLGQRYVQHINKAYGRSGTLWQGRFKSNLVQDDRYLLACQRYIELNPVRAGMVRLPGEYAWSSYSASSGRFASSVLTWSPAYLALGTTPERRAAEYCALVHHQLAFAELQEIRSAVNGGFALGDSDFKARVSELLGCRVERLRNRLGDRPLTTGQG